MAAIAALLIGGGDCASRRDDEVAPEIRGCRSVLAYDVETG